MTLLLMVYLVYRNSFESKFVLDNQFIIKLDPRNKQPTFDNVKQLWTKDYFWPKFNSGAYRPVTSTSYWVNWSVLGNGNHEKESDQVVGFHWVNIALHGINAVLAYALLLRLLRRHWTAFFSAALFAVHPIATESVTNIIGRADELVTMCFLGATLLYIRSTESQGFRRWLWLAAVMLVFAVGCFSKESGPAFVAVPLLFDWIYRWGKDAHPDRLRRIAWDCARYAFVALPFGVLLWARSIVFRDIPSGKWLFLDNPIARFQWDNANTLGVNIEHWILRFMTASNVAAKLLWKLFWPASLSADYSYDQVPLFAWNFSSIENVKAIVAMLCIAASVLFMLWGRKRFPSVVFLVGIYWIGYGPSSNFLVTTGSIMAERFLYLPLVAFAALFVMSLETLAGHIPVKPEWQRWAPYGLLVLVLIACGDRAYARNFDWRSDVTLGESALKSSPRSFRSYGKLAEAYAQQSLTENVDRLLDLAKKSVAIIDPLPDNENGSTSYLVLGTYLGLKGQMTATRTPEGAFVINPQSKGWFQKSAHVLERGIELDQFENHASREREIRKGRTNPSDVGLPDLYSYVGKAYSRLELDEKALAAYVYMRHLDPGNTAIYSQIASTQVTLGRLDDAAVTLIQCVVLEPENGGNWQFLADIYSEINKEKIPAIAVAEGRPSLREDNPLVRKHLLAAYVGFIKIARASDRPNMVEDARRVAKDRYHFGSEIEAALRDNVVRPVPPEPAFHKPGQKLPNDLLQITLY
jgi:tetratricopeptide (TPR) repeat protein